MARQNYGFEKRQKELAKQKKREEKRQRRIERRSPAEETSGEKAPISPDLPEEPGAPL